jgi:hypothetical protein
MRCTPKRLDKDAKRGAKWLPVYFALSRSAQMILYLLTPDTHRMRGVLKFVSLLSPVESSKHPPELK